jgi:hypothetical protein
VLETRVVLGGQGRDGLGEPVPWLVDDHRGHDRRRMVEGTVKVLVQGPVRGLVRSPVRGIVKDWVRHAPARLVATLVGPLA